MRREEGGGLEGMKRLNDHTSHLVKSRGRRRKEERTKDAKREGEG